MKSKKTHPLSQPLCSLTPDAGIQGSVPPPPQAPHHVLGSPLQMDKPVSSEGLPQHWRTMPLALQSIYFVTSNQCDNIILYGLVLSGRMRDSESLREHDFSFCSIHSPLPSPPYWWQSVVSKGMVNIERDYILEMQGLWAKEFKRRHG